jgi:hypothetical protein
MSLLLEADRDASAIDTATTNRYHGQGVTSGAVEVRLTHIGGPTALIEVGGWRLLTDPMQPIERGLIGADHVHAEVGELVEESRPGRTSSEQITRFKSVGVAVQDGAAAALLLPAAREQSAGREVEL